jgi:hypothetical protein
MVSLSPNAATLRCVEEFRRTLHLIMRQVQHQDGDTSSGYMQKLNSLNSLVGLP